MRITLLMCAALFIYTSGFTQNYCIDGSYCPNADSDPAGTANSCYPTDTNDEWENAIYKLVDASASSTCQVEAVWVDLGQNTLGDWKIYLGMSHGNSGQSYFRFYVNTDCNPNSGQQLAGENINDDPGTVDVGGADFLFIFNTGNNTNLDVEVWAPDTSTPDPNDSTFVSMAVTGFQIETGDSDGCTGGDGKFVEFEFPLEALFDFCDNNGCNTIEFTSIITNAGGSANSNFCESIGLEIEVPVNSPPEAVIMGPNCVYLGSEACFDGSASVDMEDNIVLYEWDFDYDGMTFDVDDTGVMVCHTYTMPGMYDVALRVTDEFDCTDETETDYLTINVIDATASTIEVIDGQVCYNSDVDLNDFIVSNSPGTISFHNTQADADMGTNPLPSTIMGITMPMIIYVRLEDMNGCHVTNSFNLTIDNPPTITCPSTITYNCEGTAPTYSTFQEFVAIGGSAMDDVMLDESSYMVVSEVSNSVTCPAKESTTVTVQISDSCDNSASCSFDVVREDQNPPMAPNVPVEITITCMDDLPPAETLTASDACDGDIDATSTDGTMTGGGCTADPGLIERTWTFTDICGLSTSITQNINVIDDETPMAPMAPADVTIGCVDDLPANMNLTATDNCSADITVMGVDSSDGGVGCSADPEVITRTWTFTDDCGNETSISQTITVIDDETPMDPMAPADVTIGCVDDLPANMNLTATDNCSPDITVMGVDSSDGGVGCSADPEVITRTWTFTDDCGNETSISQTITVIDDENPIPPATPADVTIGCVDDLPANMDLTATDNCSTDITVMGVDSSNGGAGCSADPEVITRTWTFVDDCGNETSISQTITVMDEEDPMAPMPPGDITIGCSDDLPPNMNLTATDNCSPDITVMGVDSSDGGVGCSADPEVITRTWTFVDDCGNESTAVQTITISDEENPMAPMPPGDVTISCSDELPPNMNLTATDNCSNDITVMGVDSSDGGAGCSADPEVITRTWTFADDCGNVSTAVQTITVIDEEAPMSPMAPPDESYFCEEDVPAPGSLTATDNCSVDITVVGVDTDNGGSGSGSDPLIITRTWTFADDCGNETTVSQTITVSDNIPPMSPVPPDDMMYMCEDMVPPPGDLMATENCGDVVTVTGEDTDNGGTGCSDDPLIITRTWTFVDDSNNTSSVSQTITIVDDEPPTVPAPPGDVTIGCADDLPVNMELTASDNCSADITVMGVDSSDGGAGCSSDPEVITRTWTFVDDCGNENSISQTITVVDDEDPMAPMPPGDVTIGCADDLPVNMELTASDNCSADITASGVDSSDGGAGCSSDPEVITRTWTFVDGCGNESSVSQTITVIDDEAPTYTVPPMAELECGDDINDLMLTGEVMGVDDNCTDAADVTVTHTDNTDGLTGCNGTGTLVRTWRAEDSCGNFTEEEQIIVIADTGIPEAMFPPNVIIQCTDDPDDLTITGEATASDGECNIIADIRYEDLEDLQGCNNTGTIERTWMIEDACGNINEMIQEIMVVDDEPPMAVCQEVTIEVDDNGLLVINDPSILDGGSTDCGELTFSIDEDTYSCEDLMSDDQGAYVEVVLMVTDECQNSSTCTARVNAIENVPPTITCPENITIQLDAMECGRVVEYEVIGDDNCDGFTVAQIDATGLTSGDEFPIGTHTMIYEATDLFGLTAQCSFVIEIVEYEGMGSVICKDNINVSLDENCEALISAEDIVSGNDYGCVQNFNVDLYIDFEDPNNYISTSPYVNGDHIGQVIIYVITLPNGNKCWGELLIEDKIDPMPDCPCSDENNLEVDCYFSCLDVPLIENDTTITPNPDMSILDNCNMTSATFVDVLTPSQCENGRIERTWLFEDSYGNSATCTQYFVIEPLDIDDIQEPEGPIQLSCGEDASPEYILSTLGETYAYPYLEKEVNGVIVHTIINESTCNLNVTVSDVIAPMCAFECEGSEKIIRTWTIIDWCSNETRDIVQTIEKRDEMAPTFSVKDTIISGISHECLGELTIKAPSDLHDNCDSEVMWDVIPPIYAQKEIATVNGEECIIIEGLKPGSNEIIYRAQDCCGNEKRDTVTAFVIDDIAPVAIAEEDIVVSITVDIDLDKGDALRGFAEILPEHVDDGSYDSCSDVYLEIRRVDPQHFCGNEGLNGYDNNKTYNDDFHNADNPLDTDDGQKIKVCCLDLTTVEGDGNMDGVVDDRDQGYIKVMLRVWDDANGTGVYGDVITMDGIEISDNYNENWTWVKVEDKLPPVIDCPEDATLLCDEEFTLSTEIGTGFVSAEGVNFDHVGKAIACGACQEVELSFRDEVSLDKCGLGVVRRTWRAVGNKVSTCVQTIEVIDDEPFSVLPPVNNLYQWNSCTFDVEDIPASHKPEVIGDRCNVVAENISIDTFFIQKGGCKKWMVTYKYWDYCSNEAYQEEFVVFYKYHDESVPEIQNCADEVAYVDNNCLAPITLCNSAIDVGGCSTDEILDWELYVDFDNNGLIDYYAGATIPYGTWRKVSRGSNIYNQLSPKHAYEDVIKVRNTISTNNGEEICIELDAYEGTGTFKVHWGVSDGCTNEDNCVKVIDVMDNKAPVIYCHTISSTLMQNEGMVEIWAKDLTIQDEDNCTPSDRIIYTFHDAYPTLESREIIRGGTSYIVDQGVPHYFDESNQFVDFASDGVTPWKGIVYPKTKSTTLSAYRLGLNENGEGLQLWKPLDRTSGASFTQTGTIPVKVTAWDESGNSAFCSTELHINGASGDGIIAGKVESHLGAAVMNTMIHLQSMGGEMERDRMTDNDGGYIFNDNPYLHNYQISASKEDNFRDGLTTIDLVMIQRYILNSEFFDNPYQVIAADVTGDEKVNPLDLLQLRKLILNIDSEVAGNTSWKFIPSHRSFSDVHHPWPFNETMQTGNFNHNMMEMDFIGVKVGDVNGSHIIRSGNTVHVNVDEVYFKPGDEVVVECALSGDEAINGFQLGLEHHGLILKSCSSDDIPMKGDEYVSTDEMTLISMSLVEQSDETFSFKLNFEATVYGRLSHVLKLSDRILKAEIYSGDNLNVSDVAFKFNNAEISDHLVVHQNVPNPFNSGTIIAFDTTDDGIAELHVFDISGREVLTKSHETHLGYNEMVILNDDLKAGVYYYSIELNGLSKVLKMIKIK